ncbi:putative General substrate transporter [Seiridium cardinale]|uniref:General substrate transporter n=1 Tax=Seiridium cardinale TaxID=138064 RepID=A0ABR2XU61_9PEZI
MALLKTEKLHKKADPAAQGTTGAASDPIVTRLAKEDKVPWYKKPNLRLLYFMLFPTCMGIELTSGFDSQMINALQIVPSWVSFFGNPQGSLKGIISAAYSLGAILSLPLVPIVNDRLGRRWSIFLGSVVMVIGSLIQGFSVNVPMYIIARLILGFGIPTCIVSASALIGELAYPKERPVMTSLFNVSYFPGQILAAAICFGTNNIPNDWGWRIPSLLQMCPSLLQIAFVFFIPESPRWLITRDRSEEAHKILAKYHAEGDHEAEFVKAEIAQIQATIHLELEASKRSWLDLVATKGMRRRLLISCMLGLFTQWSGNTLISYYLSDILNMIGKTESLFKQQINVSIACWNLFNAAIIASIVTRFKRRRMYLICTVSLLIVYISWTVSMERAMAALAAKEVNSAAGAATIFFIYAYYPAYNVGYNALTYTYLVELWPYMERSMGIAIFQLFGRLSGFFTTFVNPIGLANAGWKYLISYCCFLAFEIGFIFFIFPETYGRTLEELAFLFEDKALADEAVHAVEKSIAHHDDTAAIPDRPEVKIETKEV